MANMIRMIPPVGAAGVPLRSGRVSQSSGYEVAADGFVYVAQQDVEMMQHLGCVVASNVATTTADYAGGNVFGVVEDPNGSPLGLIVRLFLDGSSTPAGRTTVAADGRWSIPTGSLAPGNHSFSIQIDQAAGTFSVSGSASGAFDFSKAPNSGFLYFMKAA